MIAETKLVSLAIPALNSREFDQIRRLAYGHFGLELRPGKEQLVSARLSKLLRALNLRSYQQYCDFVAADKSGEALIAMIDALTTNHTSFFREQAHFEFLKHKVIPVLRNRARISVWSAACSSGEEPYSIAFCLMQNLSQAELGKTQILGTDISTRVLRVAEKGEYRAERFDRLLLQQVRPYVNKTGSTEISFRVKPEIRSLVEFRRQNLMDNFSHLGLFPLIFCRNVMIYFDGDTQQKLIRRLTDSLEPGGYIFIGHAESLNRIQHGLQYVQPAIYRKPVSESAFKDRVQAGL